MIDYRRVEEQLAENFGLTRRPVAVTFLAAPPADVPKFSGVVPSSCSFWRLAAEGRAFFTVPSDHYNCPIGAYTHNIGLPPERAAELTDTLGFIDRLGYVRMEEVPGIPQLRATPGAIVYAPLAETPVEPDLVMLIGRPNSVMLVEEAAIRAGLSGQLSVLARPTCMAIPASLAGGTIASVGCVGNRVYTDLEEGEMYVAVPSRDVTRLASEAQTIAAANAALLRHHTERRMKLQSV